MLGTRELVLELGHLFLSIVQDGAELVGDPQIGCGSVNLRATLQLRAQPPLQLIDVCSNLLKERARYALALLQKSGKKMLVRNFRMIALRSEVLRCLQRFLHFLRVSVDAHPSK